MAAVRIDSGINPLVMLTHVPRQQWPRLAEARRYYIDDQFTKDCRKLVEWVKDAEEMWEPLGYASRDEFLTNGLDLNPEEVTLAVRWLELNEPESAIGMEEVVTLAQKVRELPAQPTLSEAMQGNQNARKEKDENSVANGQPVLTEQQSSNSQERIIRRLKRDAPAIAKMLERGEYKSARAAGIAAGIVKPVVQLSRDPKKAAQQIATYGPEFMQQLAALLLDATQGEIKD